MGTTTTNYSFYKPDIGETGWGATFNSQTLDAIDTAIKANADAISLENLWDRTGGVLVPHTANDPVDLGSGNFDTTGTITGGTLTDGTFSTTAGVVTGISSLTLVNLINEFSTDGTMVGDSDSAVPTEKAVKTYVDAQVATSDTLQEVFDNGQSIVIHNTDNLSLTLTNNDTTNNPTTFLLTNAGASHGLRIAQTGILSAANYGLQVYSNAAQNSSPLAMIMQDGESSNQTALWVENDGTGSGIWVGQDGNGVGVRIDNNGTNHGLYISQDGVLAAGDYGLFIASAAAQVNSQLLRIDSTNASSTASLFLIDNDTSGDAIEIDNNGTGRSIFINNSASSDKAVTISNFSDKGALYVNQDAAVSGGEYGLYVYTNEIQTTSQLVRFVSTNASSSTGVFSLQNYGTGYGFDIYNSNASNTNFTTRIRQNGTGSGLEISQNGVGAAFDDNALQVYSNVAQTNAPIFYVRQDQPTGGVLPMAWFQNDSDTTQGVYIIQSNSSSIGAACEIDNDGTGHGIYIHQDGVLAASKHGLYVYSNAVQVTSELAYIYQANASSTADCTIIHNNGTGNGLWIYQNGVLAASKYGLYVYSNTDQDSAPLARIDMDNAGSSQPALSVKQDGTGDGIEVSKDLAGPCIDINAAGTNVSSHLRLRGDPTVASPVDGDLWYTGTALNFYDGATTTDLLGAAAPDYTDISNNDAATDVTGAELEELTDGSVTVLHSHAGGGVTLETAFDNGQTITILDTENRTLAIANQDTTNNPDVVTITDQGTGGALLLQQTGNGRALTINNSGTKHGIYINQADVLDAAQYALYVYGNASFAQTNSQLVYVHQDNASSTAGVMRIQNDGTGTGLRISQNADSAGFSNNALYVYSNVAQTNAPLLYVRQDQPTGGSIPNVWFQNDSDTTQGVYIIQANASSTGAACEIDNDGTGYGLYIHNDTTSGSPLYAYSTSASNSSFCARIRQAGTGKGLVVTKEGTGNNAFEVANAGNSTAVYIEQTGVLGDNEQALYVYSTGANTSSVGDVVTIHQSNTSSTKRLCQFRNDGSGSGVNIGQYTTEPAASTHLLRVYTTVNCTNSDSALAQIYQGGSGSTQPALEVYNNGGGHGTYINQVGQLDANMHALYVTSNAAHSNSSSQLVRFIQDSASATQVLLRLDNDGSSRALSIAQNGDAAHIVLSGDPTNSSPVDGDLWHDGTTLNFNDGTRTHALTGISALEFVIDGGGSAITTGIKGDLEIPFDCTILQATLLLDQSATFTLDIWKDTYANFPPTVADTITAAAKPGTTATNKDQDSTLTGWTTSVTAGDIIRFNVDANDSATRATISLKVVKT